MTHTLYGIPNCLARAMVINSCPACRPVLTHAENEFIYKTYFIDE